MKQYGIFFCFAIGSFFARSAFSDLVPVSVTKFTDKSAGSGAVSGTGVCHDYRIFQDRGLGEAFQERLVEVLVNSGKVEVLERETIGDINDGEINLVNSEKEDTIERGHLIETRTGKVVATASGEGKQDKSSVAIAGEIKEVDFGGSDFRNSGLGKAIDEAIGKVGEEILKKLPTKG